MVAEGQGRVLVAAQFAVVAAIAWPWGRGEGPAALAGGAAALALDATALALGVAALAVGAWTLAHNRLGNFNIRPEPRADGHLVVTGPYRHVRHPMYVALLLLCGALAAAYASLPKALLLLALFAVLWRKATVEEAALRRRYPEYAAYARRVARFLPGIL